MPDFIAIGDVVTDTFIKLKEASTHCDINHENCTISMAFGDKIPYESVEVIHAVGNSSNAAVSAARLGLNSALVSNLGDDDFGKKCLAVLEKEKVDTKFIKVQEGKESNSHYVLWYEDDRTILVKHQPYDYNFPDVGAPKWLYLSSLGENTLQYQKDIAEYLKNHPSISLAFQPGTFQIKLGKEELKDIYARTAIFFCNNEEAEKILGKASGTDVKELLLGIHMLGPQAVVITYGPKGAYAADKTGIYFIPPYPDSKPPFERTGSGDAFASTTVVALALGEDLPTALSWGAVNSMSVVQQVGAQKGLLNKVEIASFLASAPESSKSQKIA